MAISQVIGRTLPKLDSAGRSNRNIHLDGRVVRRDNGTVRTFVWPAEDGWPYPDTFGEMPDLDGEVDDDLLSLTANSQHLLDGLSSLEREVLSARFGLGGHPLRTMRELVIDTGVTRSDLREALGSGLAKLRFQLQS